MINLQKEREAFELVCGDIPKQCIFKSYLRAYMPASISVDRTTYDTIAQINAHWNVWLKRAELAQEENEDMQRQLKSMSASNHNLLTKLAKYEAVQ